ncbi:MAG: 23S rRNA (adenine(2503)-C(2))-methyltransferase RlmN [Clostridiales bacterium]|nr:23S rRNA (adenine(2503)-C(2))-methyltransferase RlmN [Clostridiales bacterium]
MNNLLNYTLPEIEEICLRLGEKKFRAKQLFEGIYQGKAISEISNISKEFKEKLLTEFVDTPIKLHTKLVGKDGTIKYVYQLADGNIIEGVLMSYSYGNTLCVSTQVGCRMGCKFCASTLGGLIRNLSAGEILAQVLFVNRDNGGDLKNRKVTNIVLMGSGEPLDNYDNVIKFFSLVSSENGINISQRNISLSTCGLADKIKEMAELNLQITLTISLHAPNDQMRKEIMPIANKYSIEKLMEAVKYYFNKTKRRIVFEYSLISGKNDTFACADELFNLLKGLSCHVNLIPLNEVKERGMQGTNRKKAYAFMARLEKNGISSTVRRTMGADIEGACGQLRAKILKDEN